jgi:hypothetical protein
LLHYRRAAALLEVGRRGRKLHKAVGNSFAKLAAHAKRTSVKNKVQAQQALRCVPLFFLSLTFIETSAIQNHGGLKRERFDQ